MHYGCICILRGPDGPANQPSIGNGGNDDVARKGNSRSPALQMRVSSRKGIFMLQSRRGFLIGAGRLLTTAFVADARSFIRINSRPLLASPTQVAETLYWYHNDCEDTY